MALSRVTETETEAPSSGLCAPVSGLSVDVVSRRDLLSTLKPEYDLLHAASANTLPFALHEWHLAWWDHMAQGAKRIRDSLRVHVFRDGSGTCVGIVPLVLTQRELGYIRVGSLSSLGSDPNITELRSPLVAPGNEVRVATALRQHLTLTEGWDWVRWSCVEGPMYEALTRDAITKPDAPIADYVLDLAPTWDALRAGLKRNVRESLRHCYNSLKRDGLDFEFEVAEAPDAVRRGIDILLPLHSLRSRLADTVVHPDRFHAEASQRFLYDVFDRLSRRGVARVFLLRIKGEVVAARLGFVVGDSLYLYYSGFDPAWSKYGVATTIVAEAMKYAISLGLATVNLSTGTDVSKTRWGARVVTYHDVMEPHPSVKSQVLFAAYRRLQENPPGWMQPFVRVLPRRKWL